MEALRNYQKVFVTLPVSTGDRVVVIKATWGAIDDNAFDELLDVANVGDEIGIFELQMQGKIEYIKQGRHGKVIRRKVTKEQIRFDDGSLYWVPSSTIEKAK